MAKSKPSGLDALQDELIKKINSHSAIPIAYDLENKESVNTFISTGCWLLDKAISNRPDVGGFPCGRIIDVSGEYSTGKSLITGTMIREAQNAGGVGVLVDTEMSTDKVFLNKVLGVDVSKSKLIVIQETIMESIFDAIETMVPEYAKFDVPVAIVIDSMATLMTKKAHDLDIEDDYNAIAMYEAKKFGILLKRLVPILEGTKVNLVCIGQARDNISTGPMAKFAKRKRETAGNQLKHYRSVYVWLQRIKNITASSSNNQAKDTVGIWIQAKIEKNNVAPPFKVISFPVFFDRGIDNCLAELKYLEDRKMIRKSGQNIKFEFDGKKYDTTTRQWKPFYQENIDVIRNYIMTDIITGTHEIPEFDEEESDES